MNGEGHGVVSQYSAMTQEEAGVNFKKTHFKHGLYDFKVIFKITDGH